jgi:hypothetical protein
MGATILPCKIFPRSPGPMGDGQGTTTGPNSAYLQAGAGRSG